MRTIVYFEIQIHGGVTMEDVAEVFFANQPPSSVIQALERLNIPWKVRRASSYYE